MYFLHKTTFLTSKGVTIAEERCKINQKMREFAPISPRQKEREAMSEQYCMGCMRIRRDDSERVCPVCGQHHDDNSQPVFALRQGSILNGKYLIGKMLGQGGFGITYLGLDLLLKKKVAIKEYFPISTGTAARNSTISTEVFWATENQQELNKGFESFLKEARKMAALEEIPGVVGVRDLFLENATAYIVMTFVEGETLKARLDRTGPMSFEDALSTLHPVIEALDRVHHAGIIHRDISPDNLMILPNGEVWLLDLGAAKEVDMEDQSGASVKSSQMVTKQGFSPLEQYTNSGGTGTWTDVYAMCATIYYSVTGKVPPAATDRVLNDTLTRRQPLTQQQFDILKAGLALKPEDRIRDMKTLYERLYGQEQPRKKVPVWVFGAAAAAVVALGGALLLLPEKDKPEAMPELPPAQMETVQNPAEETVPEETVPEETEKPEETMPEAEETVNADVSGFYLDEARQMVFVMKQMEPVSLTDGNLGNQTFWGQNAVSRGHISDLFFHNSLTGAPSTAMDVSQNGNGTVLAWISGQELHLAANGRIAPAENASGLFAGFVNLRTVHYIDFLDTSHVKDMSGMFLRCSSLSSLDLSNLNTAAVTNMNSMFRYCYNLRTLNVSGFDTGNVEDMRDMFGSCQTLSKLDLTRFSTDSIGKDANDVYKTTGMLAGIPRNVINCENEIILLGWTAPQTNTGGGGGGGGGNSGGGGSFVAVPRG